jgi:hypothetical protein
LPGTFSHVGVQKLTVAIIDSQGRTFICNLYLDVRYDLGYRSVLVTTKTRADGWCPYSDWVNKGAAARCEMGTNLYACGGAPGETDWVYWTGNPAQQKYSYFNVTPSPATIVMRFQATLRPPSGLGPFPVSVSGRTPQIRCDSVALTCKFQA